MNTNQSEYDVLFFDNDAQFTDFCISSNPIVQYSDKLDMYFYDYPYTSNYQYAVNKGMCFHIKNSDKSEVYKHQGVTRGSITKPVKNLVKIKED